jgi:type I restriction enzyme R subunit
VRRVITDVDAVGWRPTPGQRDAYGREIPDGEYGTKDFEATVSLLPRTEAMAKHLVEYLKQTDVMAKTIVFCHDQEHALQMRSAIARLLPDQMKAHPDYVVRVVADEGDIGKGHLARFQDVETQTPVILTSSRLLSTGVDAPMVKNVVLFRVVGSMAEFKQIIGRGTRVREDYGKLFFTIIDYTGSATQKFADPEFDGPPISTTTLMGEEGEVEQEITEAQVEEPQAYPQGHASLQNDDEGQPRKLIIRNGVQVRVMHETVQELDAHGKQLRTVEFTSYAAEQVRSLYMTAAAFRHDWADPRERLSIVEALEERGVALEHLEQVMGREESDPFDLLCHLAFDAPLRTRKQRADDAKHEKQSVFSTYGPVAQTILDQLLDQYAEHGINELSGSAEVFKVLPATRHMNLGEVGKAFGGLPRAFVIKPYRGGHI